LEEREKLFDLRNQENAGEIKEIKETVGKILDMLTRK
jgi:hypothetical protein